jgi:hypothetical protein
MSIPSHSRDLPNSDALLIRLPADAVGLAVIASRIVDKKQGLCVPQSPRRLDRITDGSSAITPPPDFAASDAAPPLRATFAACASRGEEPPLRQKVRPFVRGALAAREANSVLKL